jgi:hypothetical protein
MDMKTILVITSTLILLGCSQSNSIEKIAYEDCSSRKILPNKTCACYAKNLNSILSAEEKDLYIKASTGDMSTGVAILSNTALLDKLSFFGAPKECYK